MVWLVNLYIIVSWTQRRNNSNFECDKGRVPIAIEINCVSPLTLLITQSEEYIIII